MGEVVLVCSTSPTTTNTQTGEVEMEDGKSAKPKCTHCKKQIGCYARFIGWLFIVNTAFKKPIHLSCAMNDTKGAYDMINHECEEFLSECCGAPAHEYIEEMCGACNEMVSDFSCPDCETQQQF